MLGRLALAAAALLVALVLAAAILLLWVPSVADAPRLVSSYLASHRARPTPPPPPPRVAASITAIEDHLLGAPPGVDVVYGALRYAWDRIVRGLPDQGGSTIAQQLAKRIYTGARRGMATELEQIGLALKLEITYSTPQLLALYLDADYYGQGAYGLAQAAATYFGTVPSKLSWPQAAMVAGLVQAPSAYDPYAHPRLARERQREVLAELVATGALTRRRADEVAREPLGLRRQVTSAAVSRSKGAAGLRSARR